MKHLAYIASLLLLLCSCSDDLQTDAIGTKVPDGTPIEITAAAEFPDMNFGDDSRAFTDQPTEDDLLNNLKINILVFDAAGVMQQYIPHENIKDISIDKNDRNIVHFKVSNIFSSTQKRRLHFVVTSESDIQHNFEGGDLITAMANETAVMPALMSSGETDVYWGLSELEKITEKTAVQLKAIRNFVKLSVQYTADDATNNAYPFTLEGYTVVNRPSKGTVAPYIYKNNAFDSFLSSDYTSQTYDQLIAQGYHGVTPAGADENMTFTSATDVEAALSPNPCYFYERSQSQTATVNGAKVTYVIVKGIHNNQTYYYKIDVGKDIDGDFKFYDLLRNFEYTINITKVSGPGAESVEDAMKGVAHNNISASTVTRDLFSINSEGDIIEVSSTRIIFTEKTTDHKLDFRYTVSPDGDAFVPEKLQIYDMSSKEQIHYNMKQKWDADNNSETWVPENLTGDVVESTSISKDDSGWYTLHITTKDLPADGLRRQQTLRIYYSGGSTHLSRTVELILCQPWELENVEKINTNAPTADPGSACDIKFKVPAGLVSTQFPLVLTFESDKQNIYALKGTDLTVAVDKSGFKGATTDNVILYELSIPYADYGEDGTENGKEFTANFLMNTTSTNDQNDYNTSGIDGQTNGTPGGNIRESNNGSDKFCIRIANKGMKCIEPYYVNIDRQ